MNIPGRLGIDAAVFRGMEVPLVGIVGIVGNKVGPDNVVALRIDDIFIKGQFRQDLTGIALRPDANPL